MGGYSQWVAGHQMTPALPRPMMDFLTGAFGPLSPIVPMPIDVPIGDAERAVPRRWQYPVGWNLPMGQPGQEGLKLAPFDVLRKYADLYSVLRACINIRRDEMAGMDWDIGPTSQAQTASKGDRKAGDDMKDRANQLVHWFKHIDSNYTGFQSWFTAALEEQIVIDAVSLYLAPTRVPGKGLFGADLAELQLLSGSTIRPLLDMYGATPRPPCYAEDTEILSRRGWVKFTDLGEDDEVATRSKDGSFEWQRPTRFIDTPYAGSMVHFTGRSLDCLVTPDHLMLTTVGPDGWDKEMRDRDSLGHFAGWKDGAEPGVQREWLIPASALLARDGSLASPGRLVAKSVWDAPDLTSVEFSEEGWKFTYQTETVEHGRGVGSHSGARARNLVMSGDDYAAFMGMWLSEGCVLGPEHDDRVVVSQTPAGKGYKRYREVLSSILGRDVGAKKQGWIIYRKSLALYLRQFGKSHDKFIPRAILDLSQRQLRIFWEFYWLGDGTTAWKQRTVATASRLMADGLQEVLQKIGLSASVMLGRDGIYHLGARQTTYPEYNVSEEPYSGRVYCVTVPNGVVYVRRNGHPIWSGNSPAYQQYLWGVPRSELQAVMSDADLDTMKEDLQNAGYDGDVEPDLEYRADQLLYIPRLRRPYTPYGFCHDAQTEILTRSGWKKFADLDRTEEVATRSSDGRFEWQLPTAYTDQAYHGLMVEFRSQVYDALVTPQHRMLTRERHYGHDWTFREASEFVGKSGKNWQFPATSTWEGVPVEPVRLSGEEPAPGRHHRSRDVDVPANAWAATIGLYVAEGSIGSGNQIDIAQSAMSAANGYIAETLNATGLPWRKTRKGFTVVHSGAADWIRTNVPGYAWEKRAPEWIGEQRPPIIQNFLSGYWIGDGDSRHVLSANPSSRAITTSRGLADDLVVLAQKAGWEAWVDYLPAYNESYVAATGTGTVVGIQSRRTQYRVCLRPNADGGHQAPEGRYLPYEGRIYCVTVPNGVIYTRRNGRPMWAGNSAVEQAIVPITLGMQRQNYLLDFYAEGCHDDQTEALTDGGWKRFADLSGTERLATRSPDGMFEWQPPTQIHRYPSRGTMLHFSGRSVDCMVTPSHRMLVSTRDRNTTNHGSWSDYAVKYAAELNNSAPGEIFNFPTTQGWAGKEVTEKVIAPIIVDRPHPAIEKAMEIIRALVPCPAPQAVAAVVGAGISDRAAYDAKVRLGIQSVWNRPHNTWGR